MVTGTKVEGQLSLRPDTAGVLAGALPVQKA